MESAVKNTLITGLIALVLVHLGFPPTMVRAQNTTTLPAAVLHESTTGRLFRHPAPKPNKIITATISAYTSAPEETDSNPTIAASGQKVYDGMVAANWLPFGTTIKIPSLFGDKIFIVGDRMNPRYGYGYLDIWFSGSRREALQFGIRHRTIEIYLPQRELAQK